LNLPLFTLGCLCITTPFILTRDKKTDDMMVELIQRFPIDKIYLLNGIVLGGFLFIISSCAVK